MTLRQFNVGDFVKVKQESICTCHKPFNCRTWRLQISRVYIVTAVGGAMEFYVQLADGITLKPVESINEAWSGWFHSHDLTTI